MAVINNSIISNKRYSLCYPNWILFGDISNLKGKLTLVEIDCL